MKCMCVLCQILLRCFFLLVECSTKRQTGLTPSSSFSIFSLFVSSSRASSHLVHNRHHREEHHKCVKKRMHTDCCQLLFDLWQQRRRILKKVQQRWEICTTSMLAPFLRLAYWKKKAEKCWWLFYESPFSELISRFDLSERWTARFKNVRLWKTPLMTISKPLAFCRLGLYQLITQCLKIVKIVSLFFWMLPRWKY